MEQVINDIGGEDSLKFFKTLSVYARNLENNMIRYSLQEPELAKGLFSAISSPGKALFTIFLETKLGAVGSISAMQYSKKALLAMLAQPQLRQLVKELANPSSYNRRDLIGIVSGINKALDQPQ